MDELKDILKDALNRIEDISGSSVNSGSAGSAGRQLPRPSAETSNLNLRAEANFRSAFPQFGLPDPGTQKRKRPVPAYAIKDTWTHDFFLLSSPSSVKTPSYSDANTLLIAGLGKRRVVFPNKHGDFNHLKLTLEKEFPKLANQKGAFELLRADRGSSRPLIPILMQPNGYGIPYLKNAITSNAVIYIRPIQSELNIDPPTDPIGLTQIFTSKCFNCYKDIPLQDMKKHVTTCPGGCSQGGGNESPLPLDNDIVDLTKEKEIAKELVEEKPWEELLVTMFPSSPREKIKNAIDKALSLNEAAELLCEEKELECEHANTPAHHLSIESLVKEFSSLVDKVDCYTLTIEREELWRGALAFYKKALTDKKILLKDLVIIFKGEEGLDAGAMKVEFFELLLSEIQQRLFEGSESSKLPVRDSTKGLLLKLAGVIISHSIMQGGPAFCVLSPVVYYHLVCADPITVLSHLRKEDIPLNAGTAMLHELLEKFKECETISSVLEDNPCSEAYWAIINASHWSLTRKVTDADLPLLIQSLMENEILLSRRYELDQVSEGLALLGLLDVMKQNQDICMQLLCFDSETILTPDIFIDLIGNKDNVPTDYAQKQSYGWFMKYVQCASGEQLQCLLQFATGFKTVPPYGMEQKIILKYRPDDDENASLPTSMACLSILSIPTVHSTEKKFKENMDVALKFECQRFGSA